MLKNDNNVISFEEFRRRKIGSSFKPDIFSAEFEKGLSEQSQLLDWYLFNRHFNKYRLFLHSLLKDNEGRQNNPSAGYILAYTDSDLEESVCSLVDAVQKASRSYLSLACADKTFLDACAVFTQGRATNNAEAFKALEHQLLNTDEILIISGLSRSSTKINKIGLARDILKVLDDMWVRHGLIPRSCAIFVDYPQFLQKAWSRIGLYLNVLG